MIEFDYLLTVDMGAESGEYRPDRNIPVPLKNIFKMMGPNSSGKSTLMNIIALAAHGLGNTDLHPDIQDKLKALDSASYKKLEFKFAVTDPVSGTKLRASKKHGSDVLVEESVNGGEFKPIIADAFRRKYNLIYDIPDKPIGRLIDLTKELETLNETCSSKLTFFQTYVETVATKIDDSRNEKLIREKRTTLSELKRELNRLSDEKINEMEHEVGELRQLLHAKKVSEANSAYKKKKAHLDRFKEFGVGNPAEEEKKLKKYNDEKRSIDQLLNIIDTIRTNLIGLLHAQGIDDYAEEISKINIDDKTTSDDLTKYHSALKKIGGLVSQQKNYSEEKLLSELIRILEQYEHQNLQIVNHGSVDIILGELKNRFDDISKDDNHSRRKKIYDLTESSASHLVSVQNRIKSLGPRPLPSENDQKSIEYQNAKRDEQKANEALRNALMDAKEYFIDLSNYSDKMNRLCNKIKLPDHSVSTLQSHLGDKSEILDNDKERKKVLDDAYYRHERELKILESKEEHKYKNRSEDIKKIQNELVDLRKCFKDATSKVKAISNRDYGKYDKEDLFFESVWEYFGKRLGHVYHLRKKYEVKTINLIEGVIVSVDGVVIRMDDMGTGQTQLQYLLSRLSSDDEKMIIALFDEVSTMTDSTMQLLINRFEELQKEGKLIIGMAVKPGNEEKTEVVQYGV